MVTVPSFAVEKRNESRIDHDPRSPYSSNGKPGRVAKKKLRGDKKEDGDDE